MKALRWTGPETMEYVDVDRPQTGNDEVLIDVHTVGICGSEIEGYLGHNSLRKPPLVMGHEFAGTVVEVGAHTSRVQEGDRVVINPLLACGTCSACLQGKPNVCDERHIIGIHHPGAFAEFVAVPETTVWKLPNELSLDTAALTEPLACALRATRRALASAPMANTVVIGAGAIGLLSAQVARILGASNVIITDMNDERLNIAQQTGIEHALNSNRSDITEQIDQIVGKKGIDVVIDAAGFQPTRSYAMSILNKGGTFMNIGLGVDDTTLPINQLIRNEIKIDGSFCYTPVDFTDALDLLIADKINEKDWTIAKPLAEGGASFQDLVAGKVAHGKIMLHP